MWPFGNPRDRIVILGRRKAGKTVFLARLYEKLWSDHLSGLTMRTLEGAGHVALMEVNERLKSGQWPEATLGSTHSDFEISTPDGRSYTMSGLDYPGEVFKQAFLDGIDTEQTIDLIEHVDRAAGVILLIDPLTLVEGTASEVADVTFGMTVAVERIRNSPGGNDVPVCIVYTKCDMYEDLFKSHGGVRSFSKKHLPQLMRQAGDFRFFPSVAVWDRTGENPNYKKSPVYLVEPLLACIKGFQKAEAMDRQRHLISQQHEIARRAEIEANHQEKQATFALLIIWGIVTLVLVLVILELTGAVPVLDLMTGVSDDPN